MLLTIAPLTLWRFCHGVGGSVLSRVRTRDATFSLRGSGINRSTTRVGGRVNLYEPECGASTHIRRSLPHRGSIITRCVRHSIAVTPIGADYSILHILPFLIAFLSDYVWHGSFRLFSVFCDCDAMCFCVRLSWVRRRLLRCVWRVVACLAWSGVGASIERPDYCVLFATLGS